MKPKQAFGLSVRIVGLLLIIFGLVYFLSGIVLVFDPNFKPNLAPAWHYFLDGVVSILISLYLLRGAPHIINFA